MPPTPELLSLPESPLGWVGALSMVAVIGYKALQLLKRDGAEDGVIKMLRDQLVSSDLRNKQMDAEIISLHITLKIIRDELSDSRLHGAEMQVQLAGLRDEIHKFRKRSTDAETLATPQATTTNVYVQPS